MAFQVGYRSLVYGYVGAIVGDQPTTGGMDRLGLWVTMGQPASGVQGPFSGASYTTACRVLAQSDPT